MRDRHVFFAPLSRGVVQDTRCNFFREAAADAAAMLGFAQKSGPKGFFSASYFPYRHCQGKPYKEKIWIYPQQTPIW